MKAHNYIEDDVFREVEKMLKDYPELPNTEKIKMDIAAIALNNLKPRYVVTERGEVFTKVDEMERQFQADIIKEITKAIEIVKQNPEHGMYEESKK